MLKIIRKITAVLTPTEKKRLGLLMTLGSTYPINQEEGANERLRWAQAAVAAAPANTVAHTILGLALHDGMTPGAGAGVPSSKGVLD